MQMMIQLEIIRVSVEENSVHGSDSKENAEIEINFFFAKREVYNT